MHYALINPHSKQRDVVELGFVAHPEFYVALYVVHLFVEVWAAECCEAVGESAERIFAEVCAAELVGYAVGE